MIIFFYSYVKDLLSTPSTMVKTWARLQPRTEKLRHELTVRKVDNLESLLAVWEKDNTYLLDAYKDWIPQSMHEQVTALWPPL